MLNTITVMGRLTADPILRHTQSGLPVCTFSIACQRDFKSTATGEKEVDYIDIVAWRKTAEFVNKYFTKGRMAVIDGRLQMRDWTDKNGTKRRSFEILATSVNFGDSRPQNQATPVTAAAPAYTVSSAIPAPAMAGGWSGIQSADGDLPF